MTTKETGVPGKVRDGNVVSDKMQKTIVVAIESNFRHRLYKKTVRRIRRFMVHDETEAAKLGDRVRIVESSPVSRRKRWRLLEVLTRAELPEVAPESIDLELLGEVKPEEEAVEEAPAASVEPEAVSEEVVSSPEAEAVVPEEVEVAEEVPEVEEASAKEEPQAETADVTPSEPEEAAPEEAPAEEAQSEEKPS